MKILPRNKNLLRIQFDDFKELIKFKKEYLELISGVTTNIENVIDNNKKCYIFVVNLKTDEQLTDTDTS
jgi:hypothetical protein